MKTFEYETVYITKSSFNDDFLNEHGKYGFELVQVIEKESSRLINNSITSTIVVTCIFKREIVNS